MATLGPVYQVPGVRFQPKRKKVYLKLLGYDFSKKKKKKNLFLSKNLFPLNPICKEEIKSQIHKRVCDGPDTHTEPLGAHI